LARVLSNGNTLQQSKLPAGLYKTCLATTPTPLSDSDFAVQSPIMTSVGTSLYDYL
jgi:hypothetical protein